MYRDTNDAGADRGYRLPPYDTEAEAALIGAVARDNGWLTEAVTIVPDGSAFFTEAHAFAWDAIVGMHTAGRPVDMVTLSAELVRLGRADLSRHDGPIFDGPCGRLLTEGELTWNAPAYAARVRDAHTLCRTIEACNAAVVDAYAHRDDPAAVLARTLERLRTLEHDRVPSKTFRVGELLPEVYRKIQDRERGVSSGVRTGFVFLDDVTDGMQPGELVVLGARPSMGKTSWILNVADYVSVARRRPSLFVSLEMSNPLLAERLVVARALLDSRAVRCGRMGDPEWTRADEAYRAIEGAPLYLIRRPGRTASQIASEIRLSHARDGIEMAAVDYLQLMHSDNPRDNENTATGKITQMFKNLATDLNIPIVVLSQLNRDLEKREDKRPKMADLRNSGSIEQDADLVLLLHRPDYFDPNDRPGQADLDLAKNRNGESGVFTLNFDKPRMRFTDWVPPAVVPAADF
jgi:replicative DNA helicase